MQLPRRFQSPLKYLLFVLFGMLTILFAFLLSLYISRVAPLVVEASALEIVGTIVAAIAIFLLVLYSDRKTPWEHTTLWVIRAICWALFFPPMTLYVLARYQMQAGSSLLEVGVIAVAAALGGLLLNAGLNLRVRWEENSFSSHRNSSA